MISIPQPPAPLVFFTMRLADPQSDLLTAHAGPLRAAMRAVRRVRPFEIDSIVILPAALHAIWALPMNDPDLAPRLELFRAQFDALLAASDRRADWLEQVWPHPLADDADLAAHRAMIHQTPVMQGLAPRPEAWQFSSIHRARDVRASLP
ncbi:MAG: transposase [Pseudomonadota bacterium]